MTLLRKSTTFFIGLGLGAVVALVGCSNRPDASGPGTTATGPSAATQSAVSTGSLTYRLELDPIQVRVGQVVSATTTLRNTSKDATLVLTGDSVATHRVLVATSDGKTAFDSAPASVRSTPGSVPGILFLAPEESLSFTTTFAVSAEGTYEVVAVETLWDRDATTL